MSRVHIWIDANHPHCALRLFGMTLLERVLRGLELAARGAKLELGGIEVELASESAIARELPATLVDRLDVRWSHADAPLGRRLAQAQERTGGEALLALRGDVVVDTRLLRHMLTSEGNLTFISGEGTERTALLRLETPLGEVAEASHGQPDDLLAHSERALDEGRVKEFVEANYDGYIRMLRRVLPLHLYRVDDDNCRRRSERFLFWSNYKGSTDFMTKYVYPPFVWRMVRPLAHLRVHPNWITAVGILCTIASLPFFAAGEWVIGLSLAYTMSVLDSVDGKLARLTYRDSLLGNLLDHGLDLVHPPLWYMAWAWALSAGDPSSTLFLSSLGLLAWYVIDRLITLCFKLRTGRSIHAMEELDVRMRTFISRRNVNLPLFTVALPLGLAVPCFYGIALWQVASALFHAQRLVRFWSWRAADGNAR